ncbi:zinc-binding dehydrogenase [Microbacterium pygmaeum]|nr:zinc-binding dehydrogenase [Microbacterium pygmaeum]
MPCVGPYDALVRPTVVAICTTDVHLIETAARPTAIGKVIGHEAVGIVTAVGEHVRDFRAGDRVVLPAVVADWRHPRAQRGEAKYHQTNSPYRSADDRVGGVFSEYVLAIDADMCLAKIPDRVSDVQAVMVSDMLATGFSGAERLEIQYGETAVVLGIGPVGLMGVAAAALRGAGRIIAVGSRLRTVELAKHYGATDVVDYKKDDVVSQIRALTGGEAADSVLIASGGEVSDQFTVAMELAKLGGHVACVSGFYGEQSVTIPLKLWNWGVTEKFVTGVLAGAGRDYLERLLALIECGRIDPSPLAAPILRGWGGVEEGLDLMRRKDPDVIKPIVLID